MAEDLYDDELLDLAEPAQDPAEDAEFYTAENPGQLEPEYEPEEVAPGQAEQVDDQREEEEDGADDQYSQSTYVEETAIAASTGARAEHGHADADGSGRAAEEAGGSRHHPESDELPDHDLGPIPGANSDHDDEKDEQRPVGGCDDDGGGERSGRPRDTGPIVSEDAPAYSSARQRSREQSRDRDYSRYGRDAGRESPRAGDRRRDHQNRSSGPDRSRARSSERDRSRSRERRRDRAGGGGGRDYRSGGGGGGGSAYRRAGGGGRDARPARGGGGGGNRGRGWGGGGGGGGGGRNGRRRGRGGGGGGGRANGRGSNPPPARADQHPPSAGRAQAAAPSRGHGDVPMTPLNVELTASGARQVSADHFGQALFTKQAHQHTLELQAQRTKIEQMRLELMTLQAEKRQFWAGQPAAASTASSAQPLRKGLPKVKKVVTKRLQTTQPASLAAAASTGLDPNLQAVLLQMLLQQQPAALAATLQKTNKTKKKKKKRKRKKPGQPALKPLQRGGKRLVRTVPRGQPALELPDTDSSDNDSSSSSSSSPSSSDDDGADSDAGSTGRGLVASNGALSSTGQRRPGHRVGRRAQQTGVYPVGPLAAQPDDGDDDGDSGNTGRRIGRQELMRKLSLQQKRIAALESRKGSSKTATASASAPVPTHPSGSLGAPRRKKQGRAGKKKKRRPGVPAAGQPLPPAVKKRKVAEEQPQ